MDLNILKVVGYMCVVWGRGGEVQLVMHAFRWINYQVSNMLGVGVVIQGCMDGWMHG